MSRQTPTALPPFGDNGSTKMPTAHPHLHSAVPPTAQPMPVSGQTPTAAPLICETFRRWSMWIDRHTVKLAGGDGEAMSPEELTRFCQRGMVSRIECETLDGKTADEIGDIATCTIENGLVCDEFMNYPIGCQDYKVRYQCSEQICQSKYKTVTLLYICFEQNFHTVSSTHCTDLFWA